MSVETEPVRPPQEFRVEVQEKEAVSDFKEREERSFLERLRGKTTELALASSFLLITTIADITSRFSSQTFEHAKAAHAAELIHDVEAEQTGESESVSDEAQRLQMYVAKMEKDPGAFFLWMDEIMNEPFAMELALKAAKTSPFLFVDRWQSIRMSFSDPSAIAETMISADPTLLFTLDESARPFFEQVLTKSTNARFNIVKKISQMNLSRDEKERLMTLIPLLEKKELSVSELEHLLANDQMYFHQLVELVAEGNDFASVARSESLQNLSLEMLSKMNEAHNDPPKKRFAPMSGLASEDLYVLLVSDPGALHSNEPFAYPSTYQGVLDQLLIRLKQEGKSGKDLLARLRGYELKTFLTLAVQRGRFEDFLRSMDTPDQQLLVQSLLKQITLDQDPSEQTAMVADIFKGLKDGDLRQLMHEEIRDGFLKASEYEGVTKRAFGILSVLVDADAPWVPEREREAYRLPDHSQLDVRELQNEDGVVVQRYYFYDDEDGASSFANFLKSYEGKRGWKIDQKPGYVIVSSVGTGRPVRIYANEPSTGPNEDHPERHDAVEKVFAQEGIQPTVVVHRGHIYHQKFTVDRLPDSVRLLILGSCGGYLTVTELMQTHPDVQVVSTQGTGTKLVNDALLRKLEDTFRKSEEISWPFFWSAMAEKLAKDKDFPSYRSPDQHFFPQVSAGIKRRPSV